VMFGVVDQISETLSDVLVTGIRGLLQTKKVGRIIPAPSTELRHLFLESSGNIGESENLIGKRLQALGHLDQCR
jgi:hypothetical protein